MPKNKTTSSGARLALAAAISVACGSANAAGYALIEQSASGMGNAYAGAAAIAEDASTIWFNPAGMTRLNKDQVVVAGHYVMPEAEFTDTGSASPTFNDTTDEAALVGNFYWVRDLGGGTKFGLGIGTPFGLATKYDPGWTGRYHAIDSELRSLNFNPAVASKVTERLSLGVGFNVMYLEADLSQAINFAAVGGSGDGYGEVSGDSWSFGANFGALYEMSERSRLGVHYRTKVNQNLDGNASFDISNAPASIGPFTVGTDIFANTGASASVTLPDSLSVSYVFERDSQWTYLFDWTWTNWREFDELRISYDNPTQPDSVTTEHWTSVHRVSAGVNYRLDETWILRGGIAWDQEPIQSAERRTPRIPGNDRTWLSFGFGYTVSPDMQFDFGYAHLFVDDTEINNSTESAVAPLNDTIVGTYDSQVDIFSAQVTWKF